MGKNACCTSMRTRVQIYSIHMTTEMATHGCNPVLWEFTGHQPSSRFNERSCLKGTQQKDGEQSTSHPPLALAQSQGHVYMFLDYMYTIYTFKRTYNKCFKRKIIKL